MNTKSFVIYEIRCKDEKVTDFYIGHSSNFIPRIRTHKTSCINPSNPMYDYKIYKTIRENGGWDNWTIKIIEELGNVTKLDARKREEELTKQLGATLNVWKAYKTKEEAKQYYEKGSEWYIRNNERAKQRYNDKCQRIIDLENENAELKQSLATIKALLSKN